MAELCHDVLKTSEERSSYINAKTQPGWTALMTAAENDKMESAKWLIDRGAKVNIQMASGWTAGHAATKRENVDLLKLLLNEGADQRLLAAHRDFGKNLQFSDVTVDHAVLLLLSKYP
jgi:ankyrin repeat protein